MYRVSCPIIYNINILLDQEREIIIWAVPKKVPMIYIPRLGTLEREREREREVIFRYIIANLYAM